MVLMQVGSRQFWAGCPVPARFSFNLSGESEIKVLEDFPKEIIERRRKQKPKLKEAKSKNWKSLLGKLNVISCL